MNKTRRILAPFHFSCLTDMKKWGRGVRERLRERKREMYFSFHCSPIIVFKSAARPAHSSAFLFACLAMNLLVPRSFSTNHHQDGDNTVYFRDDCCSFFSLLKYHRSLLLQPLRGWHTTKGPFAQKREGGWRWPQRQEKNYVAVVWDSRSFDAHACFSTLVLPPPCRFHSFLVSVIVPSLLLRSPCFFFSSFHRSVLLGYLSPPKTE